MSYLSVSFSKTFLIFSLLHFSSISTFSFERKLLFHCTHNFIFMDLGTSRHLSAVFSDEDNRHSRVILSENGK